MKLFIPNNIYVNLLKLALPSEIETVYKPSSLVVKELEKNTQALALVPSLELIKHKELLVSGKLGISFDGLLSNAYLYYAKGQRTFSKVFVRGDVSINEILLTKILFEEAYSSNAELILDTSEKISEQTNYLICGLENFTKQKYLHGISLADEVAEMLDLPYVNYLLVSKDRDSLNYFENNITKLDELIEDTLPNVLSKFDLTSDDREFITSNFGSVYFDLTENEKDGLNELIKLIYYHGIIEDIFDVKFI